jgi:hypothetical protein
MDLLIIYFRFVKGVEHFRGFIRGFYFDGEANFPALYSSMAILLCALLLWSIGNSPYEKKENRSFYWKFLSVIFLFLAADEFASIHEDLIEPARAWISRSSIDSDYLYFAWFIPYIFLVLVVGSVVFRFILRLPRHTRVLFIIGGVIFLTGAVGFEMISGKYWAEQGWPIHGTEDVDLSYALLTTAEELLEMIGIVVFIYGLMTYYLKDKRGREFLLRISDE